MYPLDKPCIYAVIYPQNLRLYAYKYNVKKVWQKCDNGYFRTHYTTMEEMKGKEYLQGFVSNEEYDLGLAYMHVHTYYKS